MMKSFARLENNDTEENLAAAKVAENIHFLAEPENFKNIAFTGRVNIFARTTGIIVFEKKIL